jgi:hypothetical protein
LGVLGVMGVLCFMLLPMAKLASSRVSGSTDTSLESNGGSFLDTAIAYRTDFNINLFDVKFIFRVSGSPDTSLESNGGSFLRHSHSLQKTSVCLMLNLSLIS